MVLWIPHRCLPVRTVSDERALDAGAGFGIGHAVFEHDGARTIYLERLVDRQLDLVIRAPGDGFCGSSARMPIHVERFFRARSGMDGPMSGPPPIIQTCHIPPYSMSSPEHCHSGSGD